MKLPYVLLTLAVSACGQQKFQHPAVVKTATTAYGGPKVPEVVVKELQVGDTVDVANASFKPGWAQVHVKGGSKAYVQTKYLALPSSL